MLVIGFKHSDGFVYSNHLEDVSVDMSREEISAKLNKAAGFSDNTYWQWATILLINNNKVVKFMGAKRD